MVDRPLDEMVSRSDLTELERYRMLVENIEDYAIFLLNPDGRVATWNKGAEKYKGYKAEEIIGQHFSVFYRENDRNARKPEKELELAQKYGRVEDEDWRVRKDGSTFWANVIITALFDNDHNLVGFAKVTRDLTDRKKQEENLLRANRQLRTQRKELELLNAAKDEFVSLASHQLRTPATGIKQYLGMLTEGFMGQLEPEQLEYITKAYEINNRQIAIVESLLRVAQSDAGKVVLRKENIDTAKFLQDILAHFDEQFHAHNQKLSVHVDDEVGFIYIDSSHFGMAIENLIDNASKYTPDGGAIDVYARTVENEIQIAIKDNGVGIAENDQSKLFTKFARIANSLSPVATGSGLGLYWVDQVVKLHGGHVSVTSQTNEGTTFTINIPKAA